MNEFARVMVVAGIVLCLPGCLEDKQAEIDKLNERVADLEEEIEDMEQEIKDAEEDYQKLIKEKEDVEDEAADFEQELREASATWPFTSARRSGKRRGPRPSRRCAKSWSWPRRRPRSRWTHW